ncbi:MAG: hypothetical protein KGJ04_07155 [Gammaproteobacteria bacterium]|nr:hypothetical protein [Gammaproteobacteria bacterium]
MSAFALFLCACGPDHQSQGTGKQAAQEAPPPVSHTVFAPYINDVNKAKQVQNTVNAQKQALDRAVQAQTSASSSPAPSAQTQD